MAIVNSSPSSEAKSIEKSAWMNYSVSTVSEIENLLQPETPLEKDLLRMPEIQEGLMWGEPRFGHPEGKVVLHVREVFDNIDRLSISDDQRRQLRLIAITHDAFKYKEPKGQPRDWDQHHAVLAQQFMEQHTDDMVVLTLIKLHDEAFYIWRRIFLKNQEELGRIQLKQLLSQLGDMLEMYYYFFRSDTMTGDKLQSPLEWFERAVMGKYTAEKNNPID